jgi:hypothetical protein
METMRLRFVPRCNQWVPLSQVSPRNARLSTPKPISGHGVDDVSLVSPDRGALNVSCLIFWVRCGKAVRASLAGDQRNSRLYVRRRHLIAAVNAWEWKP